MQLAAARFSAAWLFVANVIGLWLAAALLWPSLGSLVAPLGYGRVMPLHMDWQLYGWCSLPLLGLLGVAYWDHNDKGADRLRFVYYLWSSALLVGGASWLLGHATGKPFLNWSGYARWYFVLMLAVVWGGLFAGWSERWKRRVDGRPALLAKAIAVIVLGLVPLTFHFVSDARVYPPVNPESGGATGHSLLASTLGIVFIMGALPGWGLKLSSANPEGRRTWRVPIFWAAFALSVVVYFLVQHGDVSNTAWDQVFGLGTLVVWPVLVAWLWTGFAWSPGSKLWLIAFFFWWALLALSGWVTFLPPVLDTLKFTNGMVAHAHLAMAGMVTALNMLILIELGPSRLVADRLSRGGWVWAWNAALAAFVVALYLQGIREAKNPGALFLFDAETELFYGLRFAAGAVMTFCSGAWLFGLRREMT